MAAVPDPDFGGGRFGRSIRHILVVDDERHVVRLLQVNLERAGYKVSTAFNGEEALEQVHKDPPDLIVLDVSLPQMDGYEVLRPLREQPETRAIPVLLLLTNTQEADMIKGGLSGIDRYVTKPFSPLEILDLIARMSF